MLKDNELIGAIVIYHQEVRPFTDKQIELVQNFAAQAVIAIENARLLSELRERTDDLTESLEQQTATGEVLKVIIQLAGRSADRCSNAMLENATRLCEADFGISFFQDGVFGHQCVGRAPDMGRLRVPRRPLDRVGRYIRSSALDRTKQLTISLTRGEDGYLAGARSWCRPVETAGARTNLGRTDAQGKRAGRRFRHLSPGGASVHRQADRAGPKLRRPGSHRDRETRLLSEAA